MIIERKSTTKIEFLVKAKSNFKPKSTANNVEVTNNLRRYMYQCQMMQNNHNLELLMVQWCICQKRRQCVGVSNNSEGNAIL